MRGYPPCPATGPYRPKSSSISQEVDIHSRCQTVRNALISLSGSGLWCGNGGISVPSAFAPRSLLDCAWRGIGPRPAGDTKTRREEVLENVGLARRDAGPTACPSDCRGRHSVLRQARKILDERGRRLFAANEPMAHGYGGVMATSGASGWRAAQSTAAGSVRSAIL